MFRWLRQTLERSEPTGTPEPAPDVGDVLAGRYALTRRIGGGGAALVFEARDQALDRAVAVKVPLPPSPAMGQTFAASSLEITTNLRTEAIAAMRLTHPRIARIYNYEQDGDREFLVMELVEGRSLDEWRRAHPGDRLSVEEVIRIGRQIADALVHAHAEGVVHNDIKPHNVLIDDAGDIKVVDLGIARLGQHAGSGSMIVGTLAYLSPERASQQPSDHRSDIYAAGATLYTLAHGSPPFGDKALRALWGHLDQPLPRSPHIPDPLFAVLERAMAKAPADRFADAASLDAALAALAEGPERGAPQWPGYDCEDDLATEPLVPIEPPGGRDPGVDGMVWLGPRRVRVGDQVVRVEGFWLDERPVTHADYAVYVQRTGAPPPPSWPGRRLPPGLADHPVTEVSFADAASYAAWAGKRLPSTTEWLAAYHGPWGLPRSMACDPAVCHCAASGATSTAPVTSRPANRTPEGIYDLLGNVWEWTRPDRDHPPPDPGHHHVLGASWRHGCRAAEGVVPITQVGPDGAYAYLGFRCARDGE